MTKKVSMDRTTGGENSRHDRFVSVMVRYRVWVLVVLLLVVGLFSVGMTRITTDVILAHLFPHDHPYLRLQARFAQVFGGGGSGVALAVRAREGDIFNEATLGKVKKITETIELWDEVYRLLTVSIASQSTKVVKTLAKGEIVIDQLMFPDVPKDADEMAALKTNIFSNPSYSGTLVAEDGTAALVLTEFKENISYERAFALLRQVAEQYTDEATEVHVVGFPMLMGWIYSFKDQMYLVFAISVLFMLVILYVVFRNVAGMMAPIMLAFICTALGLGFIGWMGINFSPLLYVLAFLVGARMISNAVQITHRYLEEYRDSGDRERATYVTMRAMMMPNAAAVATDVAGFMVLGLAKIVLMQQLAVMMSFWMLTIVVSGVVVPIICSFLPLNLAALRASREAAVVDDGGWLAHLNMAVARFSMGAGRYVVGLVVVVIMVGGAWQTTRLKVGDPTPGSPILWPDHTYNQDQAMMNERFRASSENFVLYYEGDKESVYDPVVLTTFEKFAQHMARELPDIYKSSSSIIDMGKMLNVTFHDGDQVWYQLPRKEEALTGLLGYIRNTVGTATLRRFIDKELERTQITLFFADHTSENMLRIKRAAYAFFEEHPMQLDKGAFKLAGGRVGMEIALNEEMKSSHALMDGMVLVAIFLMCSLAFRSVVAGLMLTVPLVLSNLIAFSYMALADIGLSTNTLPCSAVGVGVGVDFAIYLYSRCMEEFPKHGEYRATVMTAVRTAGKGIVFTGLTLILPILTWYFISGLKFQAQMGFFLSMLLVANMVGAFTVHPLLIMVVKPRFMRRRVEVSEAVTEVPKTLTGAS